MGLIESLSLATREYTLTQLISRVNVTFKIYHLGDSVAI